MASGFSRDGMVSSVGAESSSRAVDENEVGVSEVEGEYEQVVEVKMNDDPLEGDDILDSMPPVSMTSVDEPYVGQEFDSEAAAHGFYNAYATRVGFVIRVSKLSRSRRDGSAIGRAFVCNKEGYRMPDKREKVVRQRAETRVGCRAMILVRKMNTGKWVVTKFVKEHTHTLSPGKGRRDCIYDQYPVSSCSFSILSCKCLLKAIAMDLRKRDMRKLINNYSLNL